MAIPRAQLETWSHQGGTGISSTAYDRVRTALTKQGFSIERSKHKYLFAGFLRKRYEHARDSDIDVVVQYDGAWYEDLSRLSPAERQVHAASFNASEYKWDGLRDDVLAALRSHFGNASVAPGPKQLKSRRERDE
ncbi:MAG: hypothetical protein WDM89_19430 [Rhizomicrobium sp.]